MSPGSKSTLWKLWNGLGMVPDESPKTWWSYAPYRQSERRDIYDRYTEQILKNGIMLIFAFDTPFEELDQIRGNLEARGDVFAL